MNWILRCDTTQYKSIGSEYQWGLGGVALVTPTETQNVNWVFDRHGCFENGLIKICVSRKLIQGNSVLQEEYRFTNISGNPIMLKDLYVNTPMNDNYPDATTCMQSRVNAHIWSSGDVVYINGIQMSGTPPHFGLVMHDSSFKGDGYEIFGRSRTADGWSNNRGIIALDFKDKQLQPGESAVLSWDIFSHRSHKDFFNKAEKLGMLRLEADRYTYELGDICKIDLIAPKGCNPTGFDVDGKAYSLVKEKGKYSVRFKTENLGNNLVTVFYDNGKYTTAEVQVISSEAGLVDKRVNFIIDNQQYQNKGDKRYGAYMVYDNEENKIFLNDKPSSSYYDRDEGAERLGMGLLVALQYQDTKDEKLLNSLNKYIRFVRNQLQTEDYTTYSTYRHEGRNRAYNYPWIAHLYVEMYKCTGQKSYLLDCYQTMRAMYRHFGHGFYAFDIPVYESITLLRKEEFHAQADTLLTDYKAAADIYLKNGTNYPPHEVNYEQTIVSPLILLLTQLDMLTGDPRYMAEVEKHMPLLEAFSGFQPSHHLNEIGIRHWDGYWFGKREFWGDTFPHYWSAMTGMCYAYYAKCSGNEEYKKRAENVVRNNFSQFFEDGKASCAYLYPNRVNKQPAKFYDPYANDQDFALVFYKMIKNLNK
ncbi:MAG: six-hairpin glycosidase [Bacteroidales bacterium]